MPGRGVGAAPAVGAPCRRRASSRTRYDTPPRADGVGSRSTERTVASYVAPGAASSSTLGRDAGLHQQHVGLVDLGRPGPARRRPRWSGSAVPARDPAADRDARRRPRPALRPRAGRAGAHARAGGPRRAGRSATTGARRRLTAPPSCTTPAIGRPQRQRVDSGLGQVVRLLGLGPLGGAERADRRADAGHAAAAPRGSAARTPVAACGVVPSRPPSIWASSAARSPRRRRSARPRARAAANASVAGLGRWPAARRTGRRRRRRRRPAVGRGQRLLRLRQPAPGRTGSR